MWKEPYEVLVEYPVIWSTTFSSRNSLNTDVVYDYLIMDEVSQVDIATGSLAISCAILMLFDGMVDGEKNPELFEDIREGFVEDYIPLPGQYDINEYRIMEEFIYELSEGKNQDVLERAIQGIGAFRRFKGKLYDLNLEKQW